MILLLWATSTFAADTGHAPKDPSEITQWLSQVTSGAPPKTPEEAVDAIRPQARWCNPGEELLPWERDWCDEVPPNCDGMALHCAKTAEGCDKETPQGCQGGEIPLDVSGLAGFIEAAAMGVAAALLIYAILQYVRWQTPPPTPEEGLPDRIEKSSPEPEASVVPGEDPLQEARDAAARGELGLALMLLRAASLRALEKRGLLVQHPSKTDREYLRSVRGDGEVEGALRVVVATVERFRYAGRYLDPGDFEKALTAAAKLLTPLLLLLVASQAVARVNDHSLYPQLLDSMGYHTHAIGEVEGVDPILWDGQDPEKAEALWTWVKNGHVAVALVDEGLPSLPEGISLGSYEEKEKVVAPDWYPSPEIHLVQGVQELTGIGEPLLKTPSGKVVALDVRLGTGEVILLGTPRLLEDASMLHYGNVALLNACLERLGVEDLALLQNAEPDEPSPFAVLFAAGLGPLTGQLLLLFGVAVWWRGRRFAVRQEPPLRVRRDFTEHLQAVARLYRAAGGERLVLARYASWALVQLRQRTRADEQELPRVVALRANLPRERVERILAQARQVLTETSPSTGEADLYLQEELWEIIEAMKRPTNPSNNSPSDSGGWKRK